MNWDDYFLSIADVVREKSKDPNTTIGAVITSPGHALISTGYNGFPRGIDEPAWRWERPIKYSFVVHAEHNAILNAARNGIRLEGTTLYMIGMGPPTPPCTECCKAIIQAGITRVVTRAYKPIPEETREKWMADYEFASHLLKEAKIEFLDLTVLPSP